MHIDVEVFLFSPLEGKAYCSSARQYEIEKMSTSEIKYIFICIWLRLMSNVA